MRALGYRSVGQGPVSILDDMSMIVLEADNGTALAVACRYGPAGSYLVVKASDSEFNQVMLNLGLRSFTVCTGLFPERCSIDDLRRMPLIVGG